MFTWQPATVYLKTKFDNYWYFSAAEQNDLEYLKLDSQTNH